jgi:hypothetical protein
MSAREAGFSVAGGTRGPDAPFSDTAGGCVLALPAAASEQIGRGFLLQEGDRVQVQPGGRGGKEAGQELGEEGTQQILEWLIVGHSGLLARYDSSSARRPARAGGGYTADGDSR